MLNSVEISSYQANQMASALINILLCFKMSIRDNFLGTGAWVGFEEGGEVEEGEMVGVAIP